MKGLVPTLGVLICVFGATACSSSSHKAARPQVSVDLRGHSHVNVDAGDNLFTPAEIIVSRGTTVSWHNRDTVAHNIKAVGDAFGVDAGRFGPGTSYSFTFTNTGNFDYTCTIHAGMDGRVRVE